MSSNICKAITISGERCRIKALPSGYCHLHDPEKIAEREAKQQAAMETWKESRLKGESLREVLGVIEKTCRAKGWDFAITSQDEDNWRYASVSVARSRPTSLGPIWDKEIFDITVDDRGVQIALANYSAILRPGIENLYDALTSEVSQLPWLVPLNKEAESKSAQTKNPPNLQLEHLIKRFPIVARQLLHRHDSRPTLTINDEYDLQDLLHSLLRIFFDDIRPEEYTPSYAGGASRMDFLLKREQIVLETKLSSPKLRDREVGEQLILDTRRYQSHPDCRTLVCFVYNPGGHIRNPAGLEHDLSGKQNNLNVNVFVVPH